MKNHSLADTPLPLNNVWEGSGRVDVTINEAEYEQLFYCRHFEESLTDLEQQLHSCEDPMEIAVKVLETACDFYQGEWAGVIFVDLEAGTWQPMVWYDIHKGAMKETVFQELEYSDNYYRWIECLKECRPIIVPDCEAVKDEMPLEYELYQRVGAKSAMSVPFWRHPTGFLVLKNPKRYMTNSHMLQTLAYVSMLAVDQLAMIESAKNLVTPVEIKTDKDVIINLFGGLEITTYLGKMGQDKLNSEKGCRLIAYLALHDRAVKPMELIEKLWSADADTAKDAGANLRSLISSIRSKMRFIMDDHLIVSEEHGYRLNPNYHIITDFQLFDDLWAKAKNMPHDDNRRKLLEHAFALYRGNLFPMAAGELWCVSQANYYSTTFLEITTELFRMLNDKGDVCGIRDYANRSLEIEPSNMEAYRWLIHVFRTAGAGEMARQELAAARKNLTTEDYEDLVKLVEAPKKSFIESLLGR